MQMLDAVLKIDEIKAMFTKQLTEHHILSEIETYRRCGSKYAETRLGELLDVLSCIDYLTRMQQLEKIKKYKDGGAVIRPRQYTPRPILKKKL